MDLWDDRLEEHLAGRVGLPVLDFVETFGAGWRPAGPVGGEEARGSDDVTWYVTGEPPQLMLGVVSFGEVKVARPVGRWVGPGELAYLPVDQQPVRGHADVDGPVVAALVRSRRTSFRYCSLCRALTPPELREGTECMSCQSRWRGVVY